MDGGARGLWVGADCTGMGCIGMAGACSDLTVLGTMASWHHNIVASWHHCIMASWHHSIVASWHCGIVASWHHGIMASWHYGTSCATPSKMCRPGDRLSRPPSVQRRRRPRNSTLFLRVLGRLTPWGLEGHSGGGLEAHSGGVEWLHGEERVPMSECLRCHEAAPHTEVRFPAFPHRVLSGGPVHMSLMALCR